MMAKINKSQIESRIIEIDRNIDMIFFKDILIKLKKERKELSKILNKFY